MSNSYDYSIVFQKRDETIQNTGNIFEFYSNLVQNEKIREFTEIVEKMTADKPGPIKTSDR